MDKNKILKREIAKLENCSFAELKEKFVTLYGIECPKSSIRNIKLRIILKLQEMYLGGISLADREKLVEIARNDALANLNREKSKPRQFLKGTRFSRTWHDKNYEVIVLGNNNFEYDGRVYKSLTAIANEITGSHWNGKKFFGWSVRPTAN